MSIIGTRPPLISETNFYELHHRASSVSVIDSSRGQEIFSSLARF